METKGIKNKLKVLPLIVIVGLVVWFVLAFLIYPNVNLLGRTFTSTGSFSLSAFERLFSSSRALSSLVNSLVLAVSLIITSNVVGIFTTLVTEYFEVPFSKVLRLAYGTPLIYSGVVLVSGYKFIYGSNGIVTKFLLSLYPSLDVNWFTGYFAVLFVMTFACTNNHTIFLRNAMKNIDYQTIEAAETMGASELNILRKVVLPVLKPNIFAITVLLFLTGLSATSAPLIVGGKEFQTINPLIISFSKSLTSQDIAASLSLLLGLSTIIVLIITRRIEAKSNFMSISKVKTALVKKKIKNKFLRYIVYVCSWLLFIIYMLPIFFIVLFSFTDGQSIATSTFSLNRLTLDNYLKLFSDFTALKPYVVSIIYSALATILVIILIITVISLMRRFRKYATILEFSFLIPWLLPSTLIAMGLLMTYDAPKGIIGNKVLVGTSAILLIAYVIILIPFTLRMLKAAFYSVDDSLLEASRSLGAGPLRTLMKVTIPIIMPSILAVFALNFTGKLADYDLTVFLYHPLLQPLGIVIKNSTDSQASIDAKAMTLVYSVVLMIISTIAIYFVYGRKMKEE